jgi:hypothetical protein
MAMTVQPKDSSAERPWSVMVRLDQIPQSGRIEIEADEVTRAQLAKPVGVDAVERLVARFELTPRGRDALHVGGMVSATVRQTCVVSLEPVINEIEEAVDADFAAPRPGARRDPHDAEDPASEEPEPLIGNTIDLGLLATEFLILGVDPYPRKPQAALEVSAAGEPEAHPFAALAEWNKKGTVKK